MPDFITTVPIPTNLYIAGLTTEPLNPNPVRWDNAAPLKFFFNDNGERGFSAAEKAAGLLAFEEWENVTNINFIQAASLAEADISLKLNTSTEYAGVTTAPADGNNPIEILFSIINNQFDSVDKGGDAYLTIVHEIGHTLGLYHPHSGNTFPGVTINQDQQTGTNDQNQQIYTVMSYKTGWTGQPNTGTAFGAGIGPMAFDIAAIQYLYGQRAAETGNNTYTLATQNQIGTGWDAIWDTGGNDTITGAGSASVLTIDLRDAPLVGANAGGFISWVAGIQGGFTIANGIIIENAIGGIADDVLTGNANANQLTGGMGNDTIDGGGGVDIAILNGLRADYALSKQQNGSIQIAQSGGSATDGTDILFNIEKIQFSDRSYNMESTQKATTITDASLNSLIDLYVAYFNRVPEASGLIYWIDQFANGKSLAAIANEFYAAGVQNSEVTGYTQTLPLSDFINILYKNVLGRSGVNAPPASDIAYWENEVATGAVTREGMVARFLVDARTFYDHPEVGFVPLLLDKKVEFGKLHAIIYGVDYNDAATSIQTTVALAAAVTSTSIDAAVGLVGLGVDDYFV